MGAVDGTAVTYSHLNTFVKKEWGKLGNFFAVGTAQSEYSQHGRVADLPFISIRDERIDQDLIRDLDARIYLAGGWMPVRRDPDGTLLVAVFADLSIEQRQYIDDLIGGPQRYVRTTLDDVRNVLLQVFRNEIGHEASDELYRQNAALSARIVFSRGQKIGIVGLLILLAASAVLWPTPVLVGVITVSSGAFLAGTAFKLIVSLRGARYDLVQRITPGQLDALRDEDLPRYTVLVPVFREANIVAQLVGNLGGLDYPTDKLEVLILTEEDDQETRDAIAAANPPAHFSVVIVPRGHPQTKPRACNVGLYFATGEFLVIYDAEDTPDPDQLKKAVVAFRRGGAKLVCVQAALNYFNAEENALTRMFTLEYSYWFDYMLPGLDAIRLPIPLGGTSNHFRTRALADLGGWDPYNVTEDADLGIRVSARGYRVGVINSTTMEEANTSIPNFVRQRSRWIKGYMQTSLVHARAPLALMRSIGPRAFLGFVLLIAGTPVVFLAVLPFVAITVLVLVFGNDLMGQVLPPFAVWLCLFNFLIGNSIMVYLNMMGPFKRGAFSLVRWALLNPAYWVLHSIAAYKALWQLITKPHYWEKTEHGLTAHTAG